MLDLLLDNGDYNGITEARAFASRYEVEGVALSRLNGFIIACERYEANKAARAALLAQTA